MPESPQSSMSALRVKSSCPSEVLVRQVVLEDWVDVRSLLAVQASWESKRRKVRGGSVGPVLGVTEESMRGYFLHSLMVPNVGLWLAWWRSHPVGYCFAMLTNPPDLASPPGSKPLVHCFVHSMFVAPSISAPCGRARVPWVVGRELVRNVEDWAREAKPFPAVWIYGNVRVDGNIEAMERQFGGKATYVGIGKVL